jgi:Ca-activated chloride channel family protein
MRHARFVSLALLVAFAPACSRYRSAEKLAASAAAVSPSPLAPSPSGAAPREEATLDEVRDAKERPTTEQYAHVVDNAFLSPARAPLSTFSIDVDTASYSNVRRFLTDGALPPPDAVRIEELVNYFGYSYPEPTGDAPFSISTEVASAPWAKEHRLVRIGLQGKRIAEGAMPPRNLVFLIDVSGSMSDANKLPLLQQSLRELVETLGARDRVSLVVYAGASGVVLEPTPATQKERILDAIERLSAGGSTNGADGIRTAYDLAERTLDEGGINRVILATDGDFNVGTTSEGELVRLIETEREKGVFLTVLGFGMGNLKDSTLEKLADHGNGNYAYIDTRAEARKVLVEQGGSTLVTIAKDVKIQVEMNPAKVAAYRLIGYENRLLAAEDFNDDRKDAGEIGAGHSVTALYEIVPVGVPVQKGSVDPLKYQTPAKPSAQAAATDELMTLKLRFKRPAGETSELVSSTVRDSKRDAAEASDDFRFASAVAGFGMLLRKSPHRGDASPAMVRGLATGALGQDRNGHRQGFVTLLGTFERAQAANGVLTTR